MLFIAVALTAGIFYPAFAQVENGKAAPEFTLKDSNGNDVSLSRYQGKFVVLEWLNYDCPFVNKHLEFGKFLKISS
ncbi:MAG: redoxin domain-containing protein [Candidatus Omnitrophica bacterium]|nr:redoxin domain-containing protein [Candidatus Omnitrophota bacterium]